MAAPCSSSADDFWNGQQFRSVLFSRKEQKMNGKCSQHLGDDVSHVTYHHGVIIHNQVVMQMTAFDASRVIHGDYHHHLGIWHAQCRLHCHLSP